VHETDCNILDLCKNTDDWYQWIKSQLAPLHSVDQHCTIMMVYLRGPDDLELLFLILCHYHLQLKSGCQLCSNVRLNILYSSMIGLLAYGHYCIFIKIHHCASHYSNILFCQSVLMWSEFCWECSDCICAQGRCVFQPCSHSLPPRLVLLFLQMNMEPRHSAKNNVRQFSNFWTVIQTH